MLGATLSKIFSDSFEVFATGNSNFENQPANYMKFDLGSDSFEELIKWSKPEIIIHSAALTNGNYCEKNPLEAFNINGVSVRKFIDATDEGQKIIYISTDAVFPSKLHLAQEKDCVDPENVYGKSKELGEFFLLNSNRKFTVVRTTIVGLNENPSRQGFVEWIINSVVEKQKIGLFDDVLFTPIAIWDFAKELEFLMRTDSISSEILHIAGSEVISKYDFGIALLAKLGLDKDAVNKTSISSMPDRAKRCADQSLDCTLYQEKYQRNLPNLEETVETIKNNYNEQY